MVTNKQKQINKETSFSFSVVVILKLSEIEKDLCTKGLFEYISVQVAVSLTWLIRRLAANYLGFDEQSYQDGRVTIFMNIFFLRIICFLFSQSSFVNAIRQRK